MEYQFLTAKNAVLLGLIIAFAWLIILMSILPQQEAEISMPAYSAPIFMPH
jgi:hypothetical protein